MKLARYQPLGIWFPTEIISRNEALVDGKWKQIEATNVQRVKTASFTIGPYVPGSEEDDEPGFDPPTTPPQSAPPPAAEPKAPGGAARRPKARRAVGMLDPEGASRSIAR